ncbi:MAG: glycosyltransferase [Acidilobus sp.]|nr:glycosyltransferase [Acidilobus sp.]MCG2874025.1 glycosyltransferase [Acidilobus sp.]MCG2896325.1 glycosyltransferase [Acidilobus sp.]
MTAVRLDGRAREESLWKPEGLRSLPPVNVEELSSIGGDRGRIVLTVGKMDWGKKVIEIPNIARLLPEAEFYLVGATRSESGPILKALRERAKGLRNFHLETDVLRRRITELMSQASIYLHPPFAEHFGIAIAEAAAAGLVPVVYRDGGRLDRHSLKN